VRLVSGATSRTKVVEIEADPALVAIRCDELLNGR
jgi:uncharacterized protein YggU (UPF0235/DUF167 family)